MPRPKKTMQIEPTIEVKGTPHLFLDMPEEDLPEIKTVGIARVAPLSKDFVSVVITTKGDKVLKMEVSEPNLKAIAIDEAKISFVETFLNEAE